MILLLGWRRWNSSDNCAGTVVAVMMEVLDRNPRQFVFAGPLSWRIGKNLSQFGSTVIPPRRIGHVVCQWCLCFLLLLLLILLLRAVLLNFFLLFLLFLLRFFLLSFSLLNLVLMRRSSCPRKIECSNVGKFEGFRSFHQVFQSMMLLFSASLDSENCWRVSEQWMQQRQWDKKKADEEMRWKRQREKNAEQKEGKRRCTEWEQQDGETRRDEGRQCNEETEKRMSMQESKCVNAIQTNADGPFASVERHLQMRRNQRYHMPCWRRAK